MLLGRAPAPRGVVAGLLLSLAAGCGDEGPKPPPCELSGVPGACEGGDPATECLPGLPFCDAADATVIRRCAQDGRSSEAIGACDPGQVCGQPGCTPEAPCSEAPVCVARACDPGVLSCGESGEERVLACDRHGAGQAVLADCTALGRSLRCGPEPVCVDAGEDRPACDGDDACPEGERCTLPGLRGGGRYCVRTLGQGEPCPREDETICAAGLRCVVEHGPTPGPGEAVCRPTCDYRLNDCLAGDACLAVEGSRGVCSSTVTAPHREPCDTGLASPCQEGVVVVGRGRRDCLPLVRPEAAEVCDGRDDDCDGEPDEDFGVAGDVLA